ncbi:rna-directed dna polymerase from mobile element jockey-like [Pitangus sulphuratus]|nr:rna-directed dna polymerase from mobile element jockey-like [Pitangus sulphuratus]
MRLSTVSLKHPQKSQTLVLLGNFNYPDICWRNNTAKHKQSRRFMESIDDDLLSQVVEDHTRNGVLLDLMLTNRESLTGDVKTAGNLGCSDHEIVEFSTGVSRDETRKAKVHLKLNLSKDVKENKKEFFKYSDNRRKSKYNVGPLLNGERALVTEDTEKAELLNIFFASAFTDKARHQESLTSETRAKEGFHLIKENRVEEHLGKGDIHKSMGPSSMHP